MCWIKAPEGGSPRLPTWPDTMLEVCASPLTYSEPVGLLAAPQPLSPAIERDGCFWDVAEAFRTAGMGRDSASSDALRRGEVKLGVPSFTLVVSRHPNRIALRDK
jgi:hypothetical protein